MNAATYARKIQSIAYFARCIVSEGAAKGKSENAIRAELRYVCEYSEVLGQRDVEKILDVGKGRATI